MFQNVQVKSLLQQALEQNVFLFQFLPSQPFQREIINCTVKLHLLANSYSFAFGSVLVPPDSSIPAPLQVAQLLLASNKDLSLQCGTGWHLERGQGGPWTFLQPQEWGVGCRRRVTSCPLWARDCSQGLLLRLEESSGWEGVGGRTGNKIQLKTTSCTNEVSFLLPFFLFFLFFKKTCETLLKPVRVQREHFTLKGRGESSVEPKPSMVLHYLCLYLC